ncbi:MAG: acyl-ACP--UDP-N-acetylglucosamine O-acyltransferase [Burkholderiaceae bacterium]|jgi:UDP-N-acetylglucosamine acyltransferase|uniref:acyl-ACP--UDP-N-acetylglucosamine O-acyltransferase n=1 Tax=Polynucleobacter sp. MWH-Loch1C5 TaxID=2689108 RepID=UPI001C0E3655|nr:acyl-ACP--UDP-N-acetylglucosamine O-acyltransferase [Polynucleobacter sp. MWH-Loch1C5]MBU3541696.1 acyl-ACP--UDP-N-acetylglucosamine O-acyltransferase [Polynucleobacter sp. MWH-Loch1C5]NBV00035.1 acyl-ACP--UDP-N-acetylglucosamine O-acyltransferase [Burkholderiaceae bacterium]
MSLIHATAIVDGKAQIDSTVKIGPYAVIGPHVQIGPNTQIGAHTVVEGHTTIGSDNRIGHFASVGGAPQDMKYRDEPTQLIIGDRNMIREFTTLHTGTVQDQGITRIGHDNWIMAYVHIAHDCVVGNHTIFSNNAQIAGHVHVEDWAILGGMSGVHQFVRIGQHAMLGGASKLVQDLPPFVMASGDNASPHGLNAEGLKRRGFSAESIAALRQAYKLLYKQDLSFEDAKRAIMQLSSEKKSESVEASEKLTIFHDFIAASQRGIAR